MTTKKLLALLAKREHELAIADAQIKLTRMEREQEITSLKRKAEDADLKLMVLHEVRARDQILASNLHRVWARQGPDTFLPAK